MAYARWGNDSDVYVYQMELEDASRVFTCCMCEIEKDFYCDTRQEMIEHLAKHKKAGDKVPGSAFQRLYKETGE